jgi:16S rRNA (adenine1518-N6/adenine1519-N6)-dimethyltransferase
MNLTDVSVIKSIQEEFGFRFSKGLGQNFLINPSVCPRIAEIGCSPGAGVIEIGAGFGVLTKELCERVGGAGKVVCIELDDRLLPVLKKTVPYENLSVVNADVLKCDLQALIDTEFGGFEEIFVCANLPYYITSPVIMKLLENDLPLKAITVMVQKEAAERLTARCGTREAGAVTYGVRFRSEPELMFHVSRGSFYPAPNVDSAVIRLTMREKPPVSDEGFLFMLIKAAFSQRRKTFANAVSSGMNIPKSNIFACLRELDIREDIRPERLTLPEMCSISERLMSIER